MSIADKLTKLNTDITNAYNSISTKGGTIPTNKNTENIASAIDSIIGSESDYSELGFAIDIEAGSAMSKGDRIVAIPNAELQIASNDNGITFATASSDLKVCIPQVTFAASTTGFNIYFMTESGSYEAAFMPIDTTKINNKLTELGVTMSKNYSKTMINGAGDKIVIINGSSNSYKPTNTLCFFATLDRENRTLTSYKFDTLSFDFSYFLDGYSNWEIIQMVNPQLVGDYFLTYLTIKGTKDGSTTTKTTYIWAVYRVGDSISYIGNAVNPADGTTALQGTVFRLAGSKTLVGSVCEKTTSKMNLKLYKFAISSSSIDVTEAIVYSTTDIDSTAYSASLSENGGYLTLQDRSISGSTGSLYFRSWDIDTATLSIQEILSRVSYGAAKDTKDFTVRIDNSGYYCLTGGGIYDGNREKIIDTKLDDTINGLFNHERWLSGSMTYSIVPNEGASYIAKAMSDFAMKEGEIYGIASESLTVGMRGKVRGLFNAENGGTTIYTVTFDSNGGSEVASQQIVSGYTAKEPDAPTKEGYTLNYWALNGVEYDFDTPITSDITLVAVWIKEYEQLVNYTMLYDAFFNDTELNQCKDITGGWVTGQNLSNYSGGVFTLDSTGVTCGDNSSGYGSKYASTNQKIDISQYVTVLLNADTSYVGASYTGSTCLCLPDENFAPGSVLYINNNYGGTNGMTFWVKEHAKSSTNHNETFVAIKNIDAIDRKSYVVVYAYCGATGNQELIIKCKHLALFKSDDWQTLADIVGIEATSIDDILTNSTVVLANQNAVNFMIKQCTGDFMAKAIQSETFLSALENSSFKSLVYANEHWAKFLNMVL